MSADGRANDLAADENTPVSPVDADPPGDSRKASSAEWLRRVAEDVRAAFPRPLPDPQLVIIDVDPRHLHAFWTIPPATEQATRRALAPADADAAMVLRVREAAGEDAGAAAFDVEVVGLLGRCYVDIWGDCRRYRAELGLRRTDGSLAVLAEAGPIDLPALGAADDAAVRPAAAKPLPATAAAETTEVPSPPPAREPPQPVRHPFPLPPAVPGEFDPHGLTGQAAPAATPQAAPAPPEAAAAAIAGGTDDHPPEPTRQSFPLPPIEGREFDPLALVGGFLPPEPPRLEAADAAGAGDAAGPAASGEPTAAAQPSAEAGHGERESAQAGHQPEGSPPEDTPPLPLENVLTLSSFALGRETVEFEVSAELHVFGRARPGTRLQLFGRAVPLRPDGTFSITRPLPSGALILSSLLVNDSDDPAG